MTKTSTAVASNRRCQVSVFRWQDFAPRSPDTWNQTPKNCATAASQGPLLRARYSKKLSNFIWIFEFHSLEFIWNLGFVFGAWEI